MSEAAGCDLVVVQTTSDYSARIFDKLGFAKFDELAWKDFVTNGYRPFENVDFATVAVYVKANVFE